MCGAVERASVIGKTREPSSSVTATTIAFVHRRTHLQKIFFVVTALSGCCSIGVHAAIPLYKDSGWDVLSSSSSSSPLMEPLRRRVREASILDNRPYDHDNNDIDQDADQYDMELGLDCSLPETNFHHRRASAVDDDSTSKTHGRYTKTGTTIVGLTLASRSICILASDTRATAGTTVAHHRARKLHPLATNAAAAGAGTSADLQHVTRQARYRARWMCSSGSMSVGNDRRVQEFDVEDSKTCSNDGSTVVSVTALCESLRRTLAEQRGACQANLIVGGVEEGGVPVLRAIHPHGSMDVVRCTALGSGSMAALSVLEGRLSGLGSNDDLTEEEGIALAVQAVSAGIRHDLGSGSQVDVCVIRHDGIAKYTIGMAPEEKLPPHILPSVGQRSGQPSNTNEDDDESSPRGVNGFGNLPSAPLVERVSHVRRDERERRLRKQWEHVLGRELL